MADKAKRGRPITPKDTPPQAVDFLGVKYYTIRDTMKVIHVSRQTIMQYIKKGILDSSLINSRRYIKVENVERYINGQPQL